MTEDKMKIVMRVVLCVLAAIFLFVIVTQGPGAWDHIMSSGDEPTTILDLMPTSEQIQKEGTVVDMADIFSTTADSSITFDDHTLAFDQSKASINYPIKDEITVFVHDDNRIIFNFVNKNVETPFMIIDKERGVRVLNKYFHFVEELDD